MHSSLLIILIINLSLAFLSNQSSINQLNKQCLCDITDQCDNQCCCDFTCHFSIVNQWQKYRQCLDDSFGIPFCSKLQKNDINILDLNSGLRTIYTVIKRLFCIKAVNFVQPEDWYRRSPVDKDLQSQIQIQSNAQSHSILDTVLLAETQYAIKGLPLKSATGICQASLTITRNKEQASSCRVYIGNINSVVTTLLSIGKIQSQLGKTIRKLDSRTISTGVITPQNLVTSCTGNECINAVRELKIFINSNDGSVHSSSYAVLGPLSFPNNQPGYITIDYSYSFITLENGQIVYPYSSKIGYQFNVPLNLIYKDFSSIYYKIFSPINLAFRKPDGTCRTSNADDAANSFIELNFGVNQVISCYGSTNLIYEHLRQVFNYVGKYGVSSNKLSQYINVTLPSSSIANSQSVQLLIYYINIGIPQSPQYEISRIQILPVTSKNGLSTLYIEYVSVNNEFKLFVPPPPTVDAYLPNDFLYPFFVA